MKNNMDARKNGAREGDTRGERERLPEKPTKIVFPLSERARKISIGREAPEGISGRVEKTVSQRKLSVKGNKRSFKNL